MVFIRSNQSVLKEINPEYSEPVSPKGNQPWILSGRTDGKTEVPVLWPPDVKRQLTGKDPNAGKIEGKRRRGQQSIRWLDSITDSWIWANSRRQQRTRKPGMLQSTGLQRTGHDSSFFWVLVLKCLVGLHKTFQLQFLQPYWLGHRLG